MDENEVKELNEENDAREEDIVKDTDADEKDNEFDFSEILKKLDSLAEEISGIKDGMKSLQNAQAMLVENGAVITDDVEPPVSEQRKSYDSVSFDDIDFS